MPPRDAILEQALAELTELSRRVADLTATVSALAAAPPENHGSPHAHSSSEGSSPAVSIPSEPQPSVKTGGPQGAAWSRAQAASVNAAWAPWSPWSLWSMPPMVPPGAWPPPTSRPWGLEAVTPATSDSTPAASDSALPVSDVTLQINHSRRCVTRRPPKESLTARAAARTAKRSRVKAARTTPKKTQTPAKDAIQQGSAPARQTEAAPRPAAAAPQTVGEGRRRRRLGSLLISTSIHAFALMILALVFVTRDAEPEPLMLTSSMAPSEAFEEAPAIEIEAIEPAEPMPDLIPEPVFADLDALEPPPPTIESLPSADALPTIETVSLLDVGQAAGPTTADLLLPLGGSGEGRSPAGSSGRGVGSSMAAGGSLFFGTPGAGSSICFMCDNSRSYEEGGFEIVVRELLRSVGALTEKQSFFVVFFSDEAYPMFYPDAVHELLPATPDNKQRLQLWLSNVEKRTGGQGLRDAIAMVESLQPASVCFLSDGDHSESLVERLVSAELGDAVVNTFGMQTLSVRRSGVSQEQLWKQQRLNQNLLRIASAHDGVFTPVTMPH